MEAEPKLPETTNKTSKRPPHDLTTEYGQMNERLGKGGDECEITSVAQEMSPKRVKEVGCPKLFENRPIIRLFLVILVNGLVSMMCAAIFISIEGPSQEVIFFTHMTIFSFLEIPGLQGDRNGRWHIANGTWRINLWKAAGLSSCLIEKRNNYCNYIFFTL